MNIFSKIINRLTNNKRFSILENDRTELFSRIDEMMIRIDNIENKANTSLNSNITKYNDSYLEFEYLNELLRVAKMLYETREDPNTIYASPPEYTKDTGLLLDENVFRNFSHAHGFSLISFSQRSQDKIVEALLFEAGITKPSYLDIGANTPVEMSNTALFYRKGCSGVVVDANESLRQRWTELRPNDIFVNAAVSTISGEKIPFYMLDMYSPRNSVDFETINAFIEESKKTENPWEIMKTIEVTTITINEIVDIYCNGIFPDYLSIDIEGMDLHVLQNADFTLSAPKVISIEDQSTELYHTLKEKGFFPIVSVGDTIAVHSSLAPIVRPWIDIEESKL
ncbi:MAG: FkbM family methyltransferase [Oscillospiraceae bacterium]|nr:FkbM family methyltransferase [Oscillospiraceae bacterium]